MAWFRLLVCLAALLPATLAMREAVLSRRSTLVAAVLAAAPVPRYSALRAEGLQTEGLQASRARCRTLAIGEMLGESREACEARVADTPQQSMLSDGAKTSPLIEQLKQRTKENAAANKAAVRQVTAGANQGVYDAEAKLRLVRLDGVPKLLSPDDIKKLEARGYEVECPSNAALPCEVRQGKASGAPDPKLCAQQTPVDMRAVCQPMAAPPGPAVADPPAAPDPSRRRSIQTFVGE